MIAYDGKRAALNTSGLGNYSRVTLDAMATQFPELPLGLYSPQEVRVPQCRELLDKHPNISLHLPTDAPLNALQGAWWRFSGICSQLRRDNPVLYHGLSNELPYGIEKVCPSVLTVHDLIYRRMPGDYPAVDRWIYNLKYRASARRATRIVAISECTRRDIITDWHIDSAKIDVVIQPIDPVFRPLTTEEINAVRRRHNLGDAPYVVATGAIRPRKNQQMLLRAARWIHPDIHIVMVGSADNKPYAAKIRKYIAEEGLGHRLHILGSVPFGDLPALYSGAVGSAYLSLYEGFGLPVAESLACGTPVVAHSGSCLEEAGGPGAVYVGAGQEKLIAETINLWDRDPAARRQKAADAREHLRKFDCGLYAEALMEIYRRCGIIF